MKAIPLSRGFTIDVTQEIITRAVQRDSSHCVIADAIRQAMPQATYVSVDLQTIRLTDPVTGRRYIYLTPAPAQKLLVNFDQGHKPQPLTLRVGRPAQIMKQRKRPATTGKRGGHVHEPERARTVVDNGAGSVTVMGGDYPPTAALSSTRGRRRTFGLKTLKA